MIRFATFTLVSCVVLSGCAAATSDKVCQVFTPAPVSAATATGQNDERIALQTTGTPNPTTSADGCE
ncbi:hypothetical protein IQ22_01109 [Pseudomonas duriflava]|uniref:Lipoprotein n=1 Tax=Pseudomonas duriflava TaxID=459528 RepID=A0A562QIS5_9PSED|nr:hypothetical protein [Pseudomonas duriflava]TWI56657.1 hypothetical protein IQ22_01109 [Pseudomonas duriflava]